MTAHNAEEPHDQLKGKRHGLYSVLMSDVKRGQSSETSDEHTMKCCLQVKRQAST